MQEIILVDGKVHALDIKNAYQTHWELARYIIYDRRKYGIFCMEEQSGKPNPAGQKLGLGEVLGPILIAEFENRPLPNGFYDYIVSLLA